MSFFRTTRLMALVVLGCVSSGVGQPSTTQDNVLPLKLSKQDQATLEKHAATVAQLSTEELVALVSPDGELQQEIEQRLAEADEAEFMSMNTAEFAKIMLDELSVIENPFTERALAAARSDNRLTAIKDELGQLTEGQLPERITYRERPKRLVESIGDSPSTDLAGQARREHKLLRAWQAEARGIFAYFNTLSARWQDHSDAKESRDSALQQYAENLAALMNAELRHLSAVREIQRRLGENLIEQSQIPEGALEGVDGASVREVQKRRETLIESQQAARLLDEKTARRMEMQMIWKAWAEIFTTNVDSAVPLIESAAEHLTAAGLDFDELGDFERRDIELRAKRAVRSDATRRDAYLSSLLDSEERTQFQEGFDSFYVELYHTNHRIGELQSAAETYMDLCDVLTRLPSGLEGSVEQLKTVLLEREKEYMVARFMALISAHPEWKDGYTAQYAKLDQAADFPLPVDDSVDDVESWAERLLLAEARWLGQYDWVQEMERLLSRLGLAADVARVRTQAAQMDWRLSALTRRADDIGTSITSFRQDYRDRLRSNAFNNLIALITIPLVALVFCLCVRVAVKRLQRSQSGQPGKPTSDRARRLKAVTATASRAFNTLIWLVAVIYMLRLMGLDVTPIVASASIAGLAVAFAAQTLLKDVFCGFFILWENQYTVGDWIVVGDREGLVEHISLRVTRIRDQSSVAHYIPNGSIVQVSNCSQTSFAVRFDVPLSYGTDIERVTEILHQTFAELYEDPAWNSDLEEPPEVRGVDEFEDYAMMLRVKAKVHPPKRVKLERELRGRIKNALDLAGITIPTRFLTPPEPTDEGK